MSNLEHSFAVVEQQQELFTPPEELALAGFLAGYSGFTLEAYRLDLRQFVAWCTEHDARVVRCRAAPTSNVRPAPRGARSSSSHRRSPARARSPASTATPNKKD